jgi:hypothetical protein
VPEDGEGDGGLGEGGEVGQLPRGQAGLAGETAAPTAMNRTLLVNTE